jgi:hypothetical protein
MSLQIGQRATAHARGQHLIEILLAGVSGAAERFLRRRGETLRDKALLLRLFLDSPRKQ